MAKVGWGVSRKKNPRKAGAEAARSALERVGGGSCHSCIVFCTVGHAQDLVLDAVKQETGPVPMVGCSGAGVITRGIADESGHSVVVAVIGDERIRLAAAGFPNVADSREAAVALGAELRANLADDSRFVLLFPCGLNVVADEFLSCLEREIGRPLPVLGGTAGENWRWERTFQYYNWEILEGGVSAALVSGDFRLGTAVTHGCVPVGNELVITKIEGNRLYEIDNRPAMDVMAEYVGDMVWTEFEKVAVHFCLAELAPPDLGDVYDPLIIRFIPKCHPEDKSVSLPVQMEQGDRVRVTRRDQHKMAESALESVRNLKRTLGDTDPLLVLHFDCAGRGRVVMSERDKLDLITSMQSVIGKDIPWIGFFTYGEFCPVGNKNLFHNFTAALAALY